MEHQFWNERWSANRIGFHQPTGHPRLPSLLDAFKGGRVLVPLAGKTIDVVTLHERGYDVVAIEFVETAVRAFAEEHPDLGLKPVDGPMGLEMVGPRLRFIAGDFFRVDAEMAGQFDLVYDRAALVALPPVDRERYVSHVRSLIAPTGQVLLFTFEYNQAEMSGPPFSVPAPVVESLYAGANILDRDSHDVIEKASMLRERGLTALTEWRFTIAEAAR